jgi:predicted outer membrane repeat protein
LIDPSAALTSETTTIVCPYFVGVRDRTTSCYFEACGSKIISISSCDSCVYEQDITLKKDGEIIAASYAKGCGGTECAALTYTHTPTSGSDDQENATCSTFELVQGCGFFLGKNVCGGQYTVTLTEIDSSPTSTPTEQPTTSFAVPGAENAASIVGDGTGRFMYIDGTIANFSIVMNNLIIQDFGLDSSDIIEGGGGAIFAVEADITISNTLLQNNQASFGGAMNLGNVRLTMESCALIKNKGIKVQVFSMTGGQGGALFANSGVELQLTDCVFDANSAVDFGGAVYTKTNNPEWKHTRVTFSGNSGLFGGAVYEVGLSDDWVFINCSFVSNIATDEQSASGGALNAGYSNRNWKFDSVEFIGNKATYGGAIYDTANNSNWEIINCTFNANVATNSGGGIYNDFNDFFGPSQDWTIKETTFSFNTARVDGGAVAISGDGLDSFTYENNTFIGNTALANGGALAISGSITKHAIIENTFVENTGIRIVVVYITSSICANKLPCHVSDRHSIHTPVP